MASKRRGPSRVTELEQSFLTAWRILSGTGITPVRELHFAKPRRFRFDVAFPAARVAVELEGGVWSGGRHTRGAGFVGDCEKYNLATLRGWAILRYTATDLKQRPVQVVEEVKELLGMRTKRAACNA